MTESNLPPDIEKYLEINGELIMLSDIVRIGKIDGGPAWLRYKVYFKNSPAMEIHENRIPGFKRKKLVKLWTEGKTEIDILYNALASIGAEGVMENEEECF